MLRAMLGETLTTSSLSSLRRCCGREMESFCSRSPGSTTALPAWSCFMPCTSTGKFICMASPVEPDAASMATAAVPSLMAAVHQLTTACPWAGTSTSRTAELSVSAASPFTARASAGRSSRQPSFREMETRARTALSVRLRTRALSITTSFSTKKRGACMLTMKSFVVRNSAEACPTCNPGVMAQAAAFQVVRLSGISTGTVTFPSSSVLSVPHHLMQSAKLVRS